MSLNISTANISSIFLGDIMKSGIYRIYFKKEKKSYYGSSNNIQRRFYEHRSLLSRGIHANKELQDLWDNCSDEEVCFEVLEYCDILDFEKKERQYINEDKNRLNIWLEPFSPKGSGRTVYDKMKGKPRPNCRHLHTEETKLKLSKITKEYFKKNKSVCLGKPRSEETKKKVSEGLKKYFQQNTSIHKGKPKSEETKKKISQTLLEKRR